MGGMTENKWIKRTFTIVLVNCVVYTTVTRSSYMQHFPFKESRRTPTLEMVTLWVVRTIAIPDYLYDYLRDNIFLALNNYKLFELLYNILILTSVLFPVHEHTSADRYRSSIYLNNNVVRTFKVHFDIIYNI